MEREGADETGGSEEIVKALKFCWDCENESFFIFYSHTSEGCLMGLLDESKFFLAKSKPEKNP